MTGITNATVRNRLREVTADGPPAPRTAFVLELEARLGELIRTSVDGDVFPEIELAPPAGSERSRRTSLALSGTAFCLVAMIGLVMTAGVGRRTSAQLQTAAHGAVSYMDDQFDGGVSDAADDRVTPDGEVDVSAGADGSAASGVTDRRDDTRSRRDAGSSATTAPVATQGESADRGQAAAAVASDTSTTVAPSAAEGRRQVTSLALRAEGTAARVFLEWERYAGDDFVAYLVLRSNSPDEPNEPDSSGRTLMLLRIENRDMVTHQDTPKVGTTPRYRVVVVNRAGDVVARSAAVEPDPPIKGYAADARLANEL